MKNLGKILIIFLINILICYVGLSADKTININSNFHYTQNDIISNCIDVWRKTMENGEIDPVLSSMICGASATVLQFVTNYCK